MFLAVKGSERGSIDLSLVGLVSFACCLLGSFRCLLGSFRCLSLRNALLLGLDCCRRLALCACSRFLALSFCALFLLDVFVAVASSMICNDAICSIFMSTNVSLRTRAPRSTRYNGPEIEIDP